MYSRRHSPDDFRRCSKELAASSIVLNGPDGSIVVDTSTLKAMRVDRTTADVLTTSGRIGELGETALKALIDHRFIRKIGTGDARTIVRMNRLLSNRANNAYLQVDLNTACNRHCYFCYQGARQKTGCLAVQDRTWIRRRRNSVIASMLQFLEPEMLSLRVSGGEPLLAVAELKELVRDFKGHCERLGTRSRVTVVTNGDWLSEGILSALLESGVDALQVTGNPRDHAQELPESRLDWLISVCRGAISRGIEVSVGFGLDRVTVDSAVRQGVELSNRVPGVTIFVYRIEDTPDIRAGDPCVLLELPEYLMSRAAAYRDLIRSGCSVASVVPLMSDHGFPCSATSRAFARVDTDGVVTRNCHFHESDSYSRSLMPDALDDAFFGRLEAEHVSKCRECRLLSACDLAWCPHNRSELCFVHDQSGVRCECEPIISYFFDYAQAQFEDLRTPWRPVTVALR